MLVFRVLNEEMRSREIEIIRELIHTGRPVNVIHKPEL